LQSVISMIALNGNLQELNLEGCGLTMASACEIVENLKCNRSLLHLNLGYIRTYTQIETNSCCVESGDDDGSTRLADNLCYVLRYYNRTLTSLHLESKIFEILTKSDAVKPLGARVIDKASESLKQTIVCCNMFIRLNGIGRKSLCDPTANSFDWTEALEACQGDLNLIFCLCIENPLKIVA
jgi:hypothetical protein